LLIPFLIWLVIFVTFPDKALRGITIGGSLVMDFQISLANLTVTMNNDGSVSRGFSSIAVSV